MTRSESLKQWFKVFRWVLAEDYADFQSVEKKAKKLLVIAAILAAVFGLKYFGLMPF